jgi:SNF2 family DNA or RNA helicase
MFKTVPFKHQLDVFEQTKDLLAAGLLLEMGVGKTKIAIDTAAYLYNKKQIKAMLVVAPKTICRNWSEKEIPAHLHDDIQWQVVVWRSGSKTFEKELMQLLHYSPDKFKILIVNVEALITDRCYDKVEAFLKTYDTMMIVDESTIIKNISADRSKACIKLGKLAKYRRILTGTPITQSPLDLYSQFQFLQDGYLGKSYYGFKNTYAVLKKRYINGRSFDEIVGYQRLQQLQELIKPISCRVLKRDCLDLPDKIYQVRYIEPSVEQRRVYELVKSETMALLQNGALITAPLMITQILRMRQALCNLTNADGQEQCIDLKYPRIDEIMKILDECSGKVIVWASFIRTIHDIADAIKLKYGNDSAGEIHGSVSAVDRQNVVNNFQDENSALRFIVAQPRTGGYGLTLTAATTVIYHDNDWSLEVRQQSEDRCHRIGQKNNVTYIDLVSAGTIDEKIREALVSKKELADLVTGDNLRKLLSN